jgi:hypothetical protein
MAEYRYNAVQTIPANGTVIFSNDFFPCNKGLIVHQDDSGLFQVRGIVNNPCAEYGKLKINFGANVAVPTGGTVGVDTPITLAITVNGVTEPATTMISTPAAVEEYNNVSREVEIPIPRGCCQNVSVTNTSSQAIEVQNAIIDLDRIS